MRFVLVFLIVVVAPGTAYPGESMLDYFKGRLPAATPPAATDTMPIMQGDGSAVRMIKPRDLAQDILTIQQGPNEPDSTPKVKVYDKAGKLRLTIMADGAVAIE